MKLKKIASLMLAGIMAVSMLAACGEGKGNSSSSSSSSTVQTNAIASALNTQLGENQSKVLKFGTDNKLATVLAAAKEKISNADVLNSNKYGLMTDANFNDFFDVFEDAYAGYSPKLTVVDGTQFNPGTSADGLYLFVYMVDGAVSSVDTVADRVMHMPNGLQSKVYSAAHLIEYTSAGNTYGHNYTGWAEMEKVSVDSGESAYIVAVMIDMTSVSK